MSSDPDSQNMVLGLVQNVRSTVYSYMNTHDKECISQPTSLQFVTSVLCTRSSKWEVNNH